MKCRKYGGQPFFVGLLLIVALGLRTILAANHWPLLNSDEAVIGLMAMHIQEGELSIYFYGQHYMGALQAYLGAFMFQFFGASTFSLRLGLILLFALFLISMYQLVNLAYTRRFALLVLVILTLGSNAMLSRQLQAIGGYLEVIAFGASAFALAAWLALSPVGSTFRERCLRLLGFMLWGLVVGLGLWSNLLILPLVLCAALLLLFCCWRELIKGAIGAVLAGSVLGALPMLIHDFIIAPEHATWLVLAAQQGQTARSLSDLFDRLLPTLTLTLPIATGSPFCHFSEQVHLSYLGFEGSQPQTPTCQTIQMSWSIIYLLLLLLSLLLILWHWWSVRLKVDWRALRWQDEETTRTMTRQLVRFFLLLSAFLTLAMYVRSEAPLKAPAIMMRYLVGLWLATPIFLWPLYVAATTHLDWLKRRNWNLLLQWGTRLVLGLVVLIFLFGTLKTLSEIPAAQAANAREEQTIQTLRDHGIKNFYTDYWQCYWIVFETQEEMSCTIIMAIKEKPCSLNMDIFNRYPPYVERTQKDPMAAYIYFHTWKDCAPVIEQKIKEDGYRFERFEIHNYIVYQPIK